MRKIVRILFILSISVSMIVSCGSTNEIVGNDSTTEETIMKNESSEESTVSVESTEKTTMTSESTVESEYTNEIAEVTKVDQLPEGFVLLHETVDQSGIISYGFFGSVIFFNLLTISLSNSLCLIKVSIWWNMKMKNT